MAVLLVLTKPKLLLRDQCCEAAGLAQLTGNMPNLESMCCLLLLLIILGLAPPVPMQKTTACVR